MAFFLIISAQENSPSKYQLLRSTVRPDGLAAGKNSFARFQEYFQQITHILSCLRNLTKYHFLGGKHLCLPEPVRQRPLVQLLHLAFGRAFHLQAILLPLYQVRTRATAMRRLSHRTEERTLPRPRYYGAAEHPLLITTYQQL